ncbi:MAG: Holliday junction branch migration protein RuvA [Clostridioides sp.]|jgi:Holliday junction DNA helicase RuvA|nr:Holliday junction branch migration protein RuvA [Clostridioides sp.]
MYNYIKGTVEEINLSYIVLENNDIGYQINTSANTMASIKIGKEAKIYTKLIVKEDDMSICGFDTKEELEVFELLISVSKIGPKVALGILSFANYQKICEYILNENIAGLSKAPGVGKKTAERIVLELRDKVEKVGYAFEATFSNSEDVEVTTNISCGAESVAALVTLGYSDSEAREAVQKSIDTLKNTSNKEITSEDVIKKALAYLF